MNPRRRLRIPLLALSLIFTLLPSTAGDQVCWNGTYLRRLPVSSGIVPDGDTTSSPLSTAPDCTPCNSTVPFCYNCRISENATTVDEVDCTECFAGYQPTHNERNCSSSSISSSHGVPVGVIVGVVVGVVVVVGLVILVVCLVRSETCPAKAFRPNTPPPSLPDPDHLANSYKENKQGSGSGQGRDHRYAKEPGPTSPRVESVQYDGVKVNFSNESSPYVNCAGVTSTGNTNRKTKADEREKEEEDDDDDGEVYVNSPPQQTTSSRRSKANPNPRGPGPPKPKPKKSASDQRVSVFPPDDSPEQVYSNEPDSENEEDYVNADVTQMRTSR